MNPRFPYMMRSVLVASPLPSSAYHRRVTPIALRRANASASTSSTVFDGVDLPKKRLDVAIVGAPNAGKSQLLNVLTGSSVAAVSRKRHTTRDGIMGARTLHNTQLVFWDTPGYMRNLKGKKESVLRGLMESATAEMEYVDFTLVVVDAARNLTDDLKATLAALMLKSLKARGRTEVDPNDLAWEPPRPVQPERFAIVLNKVDLIFPKEKLLTTAEVLGSMAEICIQETVREAQRDSIHIPDSVDELFPIVHYISALKEDGTDFVLQDLLDRATNSRQWPVAPDETTDSSPIEQVAEIVREKIYRCLHREVPHQVDQVNRIFKEYSRDDGTKGYIIDQDLVVKTKSHKRLVEGKGGMILKRIQEAAQRDVAKAFGSENVSLNLNVKILKNQHIADLEDVEDVRVM